MQVQRHALRSWRQNVGALRGEAVQLARALLLFTSSTLRCAFNGWRLAAGHSIERRGMLVQVAARFLHRTMAKVTASSDLARLGKFCHAL